MKTTKPKKVLIALDYEPSAKKVAEIGFSFADSKETEFTILHVITEPNKYDLHKHITIMGFGGHNDEIPLKLETIDELKNVSQLYLEKVKHHLGNKSIKTLVTEGDIADSITRTAKDLHVDVIVIGFQNKKNNENITKISIAEKVLNQTSIDLFIVQTNDN